MPMLEILCPKTNNPIPTGINMDEHSFQSSSLTNNGTQCHYCGDTHIWNKTDVITFKTHIPFNVMNK